MPTPPESPLGMSREVHAHILDLRQQGLSIRTVCKRLDLGFGTVHRWMNRPKGWWDASGVARSEPTGTAIEESADGTGVASCHTSAPVKTLEDAVKVAGVDLGVWYVDRWECSQWTVPMKLKKRDADDEPVQTQQYRVRLYLKRIVPRSIQVALEAVFERLSKSAPKYPKVERVGPKRGEQHLAVFGLFDAHFGKLCWEPETGSQYDLKIAESLFRNAVSDLIVESGNRSIGEIALPIGNDFYHFDSRHMTTFRGTRLDTDGRYAKVFEAGFLAVSWAVELLAGVAPVRVVWVGGNHDPTTSYHLGMQLKSHFRRCDRVAVDVTPKTRKYVAWGGTLLGFTHGDTPKPESLPTLMATESPAEWAKATCREWLIGHQHRSRQWETKAVDTHKGVVVRVLKSLSGTDAWHYENGFVNSGVNSQAAEVYFYGKDRGYAGHAVVPAREK